MFLQRDAAFSKRVADESGLNVILTTGVYAYEHLPQALMTRTEDQLAEIFVMTSSRASRARASRPPSSKCAADEPGVIPNVEKVHRAAARASQQTGRPIMAHSRPACGTGIEQMRIFGEEGFGQDPDRPHRRHDDLDYIERLLDTGCWIGMDRYGLDGFLPTEQRQKTVLALVEKGHADRMFLSQDWCSTLDWFTPEIEEQLKPTAAPNWSLTFLFEQVIPELKERGMTDDQLNQMMVENPKRWLA
jgi:phosphotriesterase-related protein